MNNSSWCEIRNPDGKILLLERNKNINNGGQWNFPGGRIDPGENPIEGVTREVREEAGLSIEPVFKRILLIGDVHLWFFTYQFNKKPQIKIDFESSDFKWLREKYIKEMLNKLHKPTFYYVTREY